MIRLVRPDPDLFDAAIAGDRPLERALGHDVVTGWATFREALRPTRDALGERSGDRTWGPRFFVTGDPPELVGWGGFKGPPRDGVVDLVAELDAAVRAMVAEAFADDGVEAVIAHTLAERNASNRVLEKVGFRFDGEARERDTPVWRYSLARPVGDA
jgi:ribosomal-protein-alanine N-acetyltransferase